MKSSWVVSQIRSPYETNILRTISVVIIRDLILMTEMVLKTLVSYRHLTQLIAQEHFIFIFLAYFSSLREKDNEITMLCVTPSNF
jgi:hypothetical protein